MTKKGLKEDWSGSKIKINKVKKTMEKCRRFRFTYVAAIRFVYEGY